MSEELSKRWRDSWLRGKTKFHTQDTIHDLGDAMATRLDILEAENAELTKLVSDAAKHMSGYAPDPAPFNQPLWERLIRFTHYV